MFLATLTFKVFAILLESISTIPRISMSFVHLIQDPRKVEDQGKRNGSRGPLKMKLRRRRRPQRIRKRGRYRLNLMIRLSIGIERGRRKRKRGLQKSNSGPIEENLPMTTT